jgi:hypothetical protein
MNRLLSGMQRRPRLRAVGFGADLFRGRDRRSSALVLHRSRVAFTLGLFGVPLFRADSDLLQRVFEARAT